MRLRTLAMLGLTCTTVFMSAEGWGYDDEQEMTTQYQQIVDLYVQGLQSHWGPQEYIDHSLCYLGGYEKSLEQVGFYLRDLNGDEIPELLIGNVSDEGKTASSFWDLYTIEDGKIALVCRSAERDMYYLCNNYEMIGNTGSAGAALSSYCWYQMEGYDLEIVESVFYDGFYDEDHPWFYSRQDAVFEDYSTPVSEEEAISIMDGYEEVDIPYISFADASTVVQSGKMLASGNE